MSPVVLHIPHASKNIPEDVRSTFLPDDAVIERELLVMTDHLTDEIVAGFRAEVDRVIFGVSRLVVDPERFPDDVDEPMAARGMGATYTRLSSGEPLRVLSATERCRLMETYYYPHHARLEQAVKEALLRHGHCLIIDVHSFSSAALPHEPDQTPRRPEVCIGFDRFHSPFRHDDDVLRACGEMQLSADINRPFSGSIMPRRYWNADARVRSFMIEVRRDLYMVSGLMAAGPS
jgi:N-formylglutamate deformylase